ncbi:hypothetical protein BCR42DRAFT_409046 [Absidia repens]|uniref:Uncharacterized protein n=1 Tax=Absidia repens TaxID=90262 RepID=A0A1X2IQJ9_9FUNG|nr:hypothetical protein BCR42DRAFT_409046 [Absidia repens]
MLQRTIANGKSPMVPSNTLQQQEQQREKEQEQQQQPQQQKQQPQQQHASSSHDNNNNSFFVAAINNGYTAASREFERFFSSWGFNKRPKGIETNNVDSMQNKYHGKRKRDSYDNKDNSGYHNDSVVYARIIPDENRQHHGYPPTFSAHNNSDTTTTTTSITSKPLTESSTPRILEPLTSTSLSNNSHHHRHTFQFLVERPHSPPTRLNVTSDTAAIPTDKQHGNESASPSKTTTYPLNHDATTSRSKLESTPNSTITRLKSMQSSYMTTGNDAAKYVDMDHLEEERLAKLERIIQEAHFNATQLLSISQNSKAARTVRFSPIINHESMISPRISRPSSSPPPPLSLPLTSSQSYLSPRRSSPRPSSAYSRAKRTLSLESPETSPKSTATTSPIPPRIRNESTGPSSSSMSRFAHDSFISTTNITSETIPKSDDKNDIYHRTERIPLKTDFPSSRSTSLEPFSTSSTGTKLSSPSSSPPFHQRLSSASTQPPVDHLFEQGQQQNIVNGHKVLPTEQSPRKKLKTADFDKEHKKNMGIIIHQIPKVTLRRTDIIRGRDGQLKPNPIWNEIYNNGKNKSRPL